MNEKQNTRISKTKLLQITSNLNGRDMEILEHIYKVKFTTNEQLARVFFSNSKNDTARLRACNRATKRLKDFGVISHLEKRIGGVRAGSKSLVWAVSGIGYKILKNGDVNLKATRKHFYEPKTLFLKHSLAVTEIYTKLIELDQQKRIELLVTDFEPSCWRSFLFQGTPTFLKPDLYVSLALNQYEDTYFIEVDNDTEHPKRIINQNKLYIAYLNSGMEQRQNDGVFPFVVWIVPNIKRREQLLRYIREELPNAVMLFRVITLYEFETLICGDNEKEEN